MNLKKSLLVTLLVGALILPGLIFNASADAEETLRIGAPPWIFKKSPLEEVAQRFEEDHPDVNVKLVREGKWNAPKYITQWKEGDTSIDLALMGTGSMIAPLIKGDWLEPLGGLLEDHMAKDKFVGGFLSAAHYKKPNSDGTYYPVLPILGEVAIIGLNTENAEKAGLWENGEAQPIPSFDKEEEFLNWFEQLDGSSPVGAHVQIWDREFMQYNYCGPIKAMTGTFLEEDGKGFDVTSDAAKKWLKLTQKMYDQNLGAWVTSDDAGYSKWKTGAAGSFYAAQSHSMELVSVTEDESDLAYIGWPGSDENGSVIWTQSVWIPKVSPNKELAKTFIKEQIFSPHFHQWSFNEYGKLPTLTAYYEDGITWFEDQMPTIVNIADASKPIPVYADMDEYLDILMNNLPDAAMGRMEIEEALNNIKEESQDLDFTNLRAE